MIYDIWLTKIPGIGCHLQRRLLAQFGSAENIYNAGKEELLRTPGIGEAKIREIQNAKSLDKAELILKKCTSYDIKIMTYNDAFYRERAGDFSNMPILLYYKGTVKRMKQYIGIVGSRRCTQEGKHKTVKLVKEIWTPNTTIVSGMAKGVDSYAHTACLNLGGYTIAVLGNGLDICYPAEHHLLWEKIIEYGLLLSEYEPETPPRSYQFPLRNRIIAAFSDRIYVPEKGKISGVDYTLQYAKEYNKDITIL